MKIREQVELALVLAPMILWAAVFVSALLRGAVTLCPKCGSHRFRRSLKRLVDAVYPAFVPAYRCEVCKKRFRTIMSYDYTRGVATSHLPGPVQEIRPGIMYPFRAGMELCTRRWSRRASQM